MSAISASRLRPLIGSRSFYREAVLVMLPVAGQQLLNSMFGFFDNLMVGMVDAATLSGVTVANKVFFVYQGIFWGITGAGGLLLSQYYGAGDRKNCQILFALQQLAGLLVAIAFTGILLVAPEMLLRAFVSDPATIAAGMGYVELIRFSYLPAAVSMVSLFSLRSVGQSKVPFVVGLFTISVNIVLNWIFIFGKLGLPAMGGRGAALATLIARIVEMLFYLVWIGSGRTWFTWNIAAARGAGRKLIRMVADKTFPLIANEFLWTMGTNMLFWSYARINEYAVPALVIVEQSMQFVYVMFGGMSAGVAILIGSRLGAGRFEEARRNSNQLMFMASCIGLVLMIISVAVSGVLPGFFNVSDELRQMATLLIRIQTLFFIPQILYTNIFFVLRAGGDIPSAFRLDAVYTWLVPIPLAILIATVVPLVTPVSIVVAYVITQFMLNAKLALAFKYYAKGLWLKNLTVEHNHDQDHDQSDQTGQPGNPSPSISGIS